MAWVCSCGQKNLVSGVPCLACDRYAPVNTEKSQAKGPQSRFEAHGGSRFREEPDGVQDTAGHRFRETESVAAQANVQSSVQAPAQQAEPSHWVEPDPEPAPMPEPQNEYLAETPEGEWPDVERRHFADRRNPDDRRDGDRRGLQRRFSEQSKSRPAQARPESHFEASLPARDQEVAHEDVAHEDDNLEVVASFEPAVEQQESYYDDFEVREGEQFAVIEEALEQPQVAGPQGIDLFADWDELDQFAVDTPTDEDESADGSDAFDDEATQAHFFPEPEQEPDQEQQVEAQPWWEGESATSPTLAPAFDWGNPDARYGVASQQAEEEFGSPDYEMQEPVVVAEGFSDEAFGSVQSYPSQDFVDSDLQGFGYEGEHELTGYGSQSQQHHFGDGTFGFDNDVLPYDADSFEESPAPAKQKKAKGKARFATNVDLDEPDDFESFDDWGFDDEIDDDDYEPQNRARPRGKKPANSKRPAQSKRRANRAPADPMDLGAFMRKWGKFLIVIAILIAVVLIASFGKVFARVGASQVGGPKPVACSVASKSPLRSADLQNTLAGQFGWTAKPDYEARTGVIDYSRALQLEPDQSNALNILDRTRFVGGYDRTFTSQSSSSATMNVIVYQFASSVCAAEYASNRVSSSASTKDFAVPGIDNAKGLVLKADGGNIYQVVAPQDQFVMMISIAKSTATDPAAEINRAAEAQVGILKTA